MIRLFALLLISAFLISATAAFAQSRPDTAYKTVDLNEFVLRQSGLKTLDRKVRLHKSSLLFKSQTGAIRTGQLWDSLMLLTHFPAPTPRSMVLQSVSSRLAALDTSKLDVYLVIVQFRSSDTLFRRMRITPEMLDARAKRFEIDLRDSAITLAPEPFYLGFGFRTRILSEDYSFPFYHTRGGEGAHMVIRNGRWYVTTKSVFHAYPFRMTYVESGG